MPDMKKLFVTLFTLWIFSFFACDVKDDMIPDVDTDFTEIFKIQIFSGTGVSPVKIIDVSGSEEYNDFKNNIGGFEIRKITCQVKNCNAPEDMYFTGTIYCSNEEDNEEFSVGSIQNVNLSELAASGLEMDIPVIKESMNKVLSWLDDPGRFKVKSAYSLFKYDGSPYKINSSNEGSNFELMLTFYITVITEI